MFKNIENMTDAQFEKWFDLFVEEKGIDTEHVFEVEGEWGTNYIPFSVLRDMIVNIAPNHERNGIMTMIVRIDFANGDVMDYLQHLCRAIAI